MLGYSSSRKLYQMQLVKSGAASCFGRFIKQFTRVKSERSWPKNSVCVCVCVCVCMHALSHIWLFGKPWTVDHQSLLFMGLPRQDYYWSRLLFPTPEDLPDPGIEPSFLESPEFAGRFFTTGAIWEALGKVELSLPLTQCFPNIWHWRLSCPHK